MTQVARHWIGGEWVFSTTGNTGSQINPSTGELIGEFADGGSSEAEAAIAAARRAFDATLWSRQPRLRSAILLQMADRIEAATADLAASISQQNGKLMSEAKYEVAAGVSELRYYAGMARTISSRLLEAEPGIYSALMREPMGVAGIIVPWNAPLVLLTRSLAPALAAGCSAVVKAPAQTALLNAQIFQLWQDLPLPPGILNLIYESGSVAAQALVVSPSVDVISYTGSTDVGKRIMATAASTLKRLNLELGGSAPCLVYADANLEKAAAGIVRAGLAHAGQVCVAASRVLAHEQVCDQLQDEIAGHLRSVKVGRADDVDVQMGPMINERSRRRVQQVVADSQVTGEVVVRGEPIGSSGFLLRPSLVRVQREPSPMLDQEVFGPALSIVSFRDEEEAVAKANDTRFGLAASVWTRDLEKAQRTAAELHCGTVWINSHLRILAEAEIGGYKESGIGRLHGVEGLEAFLQTKHVSWSIGA